MKSLLLENLSFNVHINELDSQVTPLRLDWMDIPASAPSVDVILIADLIYNYGVAELLLNVRAHLLEQC
jgi:predicted nicotinamide N-methyase